MEHITELEMDFDLVIIFMTLFYKMTRKNYPE